MNAVVKAERKAGALRRRLSLLEGLAALAKGEDRDLPAEWWRVFGRVRAEVTVAEANVCKAKEKENGHP